MSPRKKVIVVLGIQVVICIAAYFFATSGVVEAVTSEMWKKPCNPNSFAAHILGRRSAVQVLCW